MDLLTMLAECRQFVLFGTNLNGKVFTGYTLKAKTYQLTFVAIVIVNCDCKHLIRVLDIKLNQLVPLWLLAS